MDPHHHLIIAKGKTITKDVATCAFEPQTQKFNVAFLNGQVFSYSKENLIYLEDPESRDPQHFRIAHEKGDLFGIAEILVFQDENHRYWHIEFQTGFTRDFDERSLAIQTSCLTGGHAQNVLRYLKTTASLGNLVSEDGTNLLAKQYEKIQFVGNDTVLATYIAPDKHRIQYYGNPIPIFPFGCNSSQFTAVKNALSQQLSVIQGPPGTGKTQTILNILANLLVAGKSVQVVSNNNSAIQNVLEKLSAPEFDLAFLVAHLGNSENKKVFLDRQTGVYPEGIKSWLPPPSDDPIPLREIRSRAARLSSVFQVQEQLAEARQKLNQVEVEYLHFTQCASELKVTLTNLEVRRRLDAEKVRSLWIRCEQFFARKKRLPLRFRLECRFVYRILTWSQFRAEASALIVIFQALFYKIKQEELVREIHRLESHEDYSRRDELLHDLTHQSEEYLKGVLARKYEQKSEQRIFTDEDLWKNPAEVEVEYPIVLSTTFSARSSLGKTADFDYIIMDEASQVDVATGALAISCAKNAVIVGDPKQLPNVVTDEIRAQSQEIFDTAAVSSGYNFSEKSFLQSVLDVVPGVPQTLLREHYRCHPKIIGFCNQKFYGGELIVMTKDAGEEDVLSVIKTPVGNHARGHFNRRQIDVIVQEVLPSLKSLNGTVGIIAPYRKQVEALEVTLEQPTLQVDTVHKFQGREKDVIVLSTVDDQVTKFSDDPLLLNVAVSRAKKKLCLVVSGNEPPQKSNVQDLVDYVEYMNCSVMQSSTYSIFDLLYGQYEQTRHRFLKAYRRVSQYDSENLMHALITDLLKDEAFRAFGVACHVPLRMIVRDRQDLPEDAQRYSMNVLTHVDFLIFRRVSRKPCLAIEVDGVKFHQKGTRQHERDEMKDEIMETCGIPLMRFATNGSGERELLVSKLREFV